MGTIWVLDTQARLQGLSVVERSALEFHAHQVEAQLELRVAMKEREVHLAALRRLAAELAFRRSRPRGAQGHHI